MASRCGRSSWVRTSGVVLSTPLVQALAFTFALALALALALPVAPAAAASKPAAAKGAPSKGARPKTAKDWATEGATHHKLGEFALAIAAYKEAYRLKPHPVHLYNIAIAFRQLGNYRESARYYRLYLADEPATSLRPEVERRIEELEKLAKDAEASKTAPPTTPVAAPDEPKEDAPGDGAAADPPLPGVTPPDPGTDGSPEPRRRGLAIGLGVGGGVLVVGGAIAAVVLFSMKTEADRFLADFPGQRLDLGGD